MKEKALGICQINTEFKKKKKRKAFVLVLVPTFFVFYWHRSGRDLAASELFLTDQGGPSESLCPVIFVLCFGRFYPRAQEPGTVVAGGQQCGLVFIFIFALSRVG